jgi:hypothetical protein
MPMPPSGWRAFQAATASRLEGGVAPGATMLDPLGVSLDFLPFLPFPMLMMIGDDEEEKGGEITVKWFDLYFSFLGLKSRS